jgi:uncharacterized protein YllA (UPF0747 family)
MNDILTGFAEQGVLGLAAAVALWLAWKKDRQLQVLYQRWIEKADRNNSKSLELVDAMGNTLRTMLATQEQIDRRLADIERKRAP